MLVRMIFTIGESRSGAVGMHFFSEQSSQMSLEPLLRARSHTAIVIAMSWSQLQKCVSKAILVDCDIAV